MFNCQYMVNYKMYCFVIDLNWEKEKNKNIITILFYIFMI